MLPNVLLGCNVVSVRAQARRDIADASRDLDSATACFPCWGTMRREQQAEVVQNLRASVMRSYEVCLPRFHDPASDAARSRFPRRRRRSRSSSMPGYFTLPPRLAQDPSRIPPRCHWSSSATTPMPTTKPSSRD